MTTNFLLNTLCAMATGVLFLAGSLQAETDLRFQEAAWNGKENPVGDYEVKDACADGYAPSTNQGAKPWVFVADSVAGNRHPVFYFDLSAVPAKSRVVAATLTLTPADHTSESRQVTWEVRGLPAGNAGWEPMNATFNYRDESGTTAWKLADGKDAPDATAAALSSPVLGVYTGYLANNEPVTVELDPQRVQEWIDHPESYAGFMLYQAKGSNFALHMSKSPREDARPLLTLTVEP